MSHVSPPVMSANRRQWSAVVALSLGAFALVASEFMPVSLLTPIASDLGVSEGRAGLSIAVSGAFALVTSLIISPLTAGVDRKRLLLALTLAMVLSSTLVALAPNYGVFMLGRALIGVAIGGFWSLSAATAMRLVPPPQVPRALALINGGNALASVVAAPLGSYFGSIFGWRGAFFSLVPLALVALAWKGFTLPVMRPTEARPSWNALRLLARADVAWGMIATSLFFMAQFCLFTYLRPYLETVTRVEVSTLSLMLLWVGGTGLLGTFLIEPFVKQGLFRTLAWLPIGMALLATVLALASPGLGWTAVILGLWGLLATSAPVAWWTWLARTLPDDGEAAGGLMVAVVQLAIAMGATVGGLLFDGLGYRATFLLSACLFVASMLASRCAAARNAR